MAKSQSNQTVKNKQKKAPLKKLLGDDKQTRTKVKQAEFIKAFIKNIGVVYRSCEEVDINEATYYKWLREDPEFREMLTIAENRFCNALVASMFKRGLEKDNTASIFLLKSLQPEKYDEGVRAQRIQNEGMRDMANTLKAPVFVSAEEVPAEELRLLTHNEEEDK
jgi:hypothetical protein